MDSSATDAARVLRLDELVEEVRSSLADAYARPLVVADPVTGTVCVLDGKPLRIAAGTLRRLHGEAAAARVVALDIDALPWRAVPAAGLRLWRQHGRSGAGGEVVTELEAGDPPVQLVTSEEGWQLVRCIDGAQGWIDPEHETLEVAARPAAIADLADSARVDRERFVAAAIALLDVPYVWGGATSAGVDCSGIVQRCAWAAGGCWLPRHSRALLTVGDRVAPSSIARGDVLVLKRNASTYEAERQAQLAALAAEQERTGIVPAHGPAIHPMHVAIALSDHEVLHASRDAMRVVREPLADVRARYRVLGVRRLGPSKEHA